MDTIKPLFTATATATGGRNGYTESSDGVVKANLSVPKEMGGPGKPGTATPEHLFAAGYAACFGGALDFVGKRAKKDASKARITCAVSIGPREGGGFGLAVKLSVQDRSLPQAELAALAREAHEQICPYSHATHTNFVSTGAPALIVFVTGVFSAISASAAFCSPLSAALKEIARLILSAPVAGSFSSSTSTWIAPSSQPLRAATMRSVIAVQAASAETRSS